MPQNIWMQHCKMKPLGNGNENGEELILKCENENCITKGNAGYFRLCTRC